MAEERQPSQADAPPSSDMGGKHTRETSGGTTCPDCMGAGRRDGETCPTCAGTGVAPEEAAGGG